MSTIVLYDGVFYSDTQTTTILTDEETGDTMILKRTHGTNKVYYHNGKLYGATGDSRGWLDFRDNNGHWRWSFYPFPESAIVEWDGKTARALNFRQKRILGIYIRWWKETKIGSNQYVAFGSGSNAASEAIDKGLSPTEAVQYASDRDEYTDDNVVTKQL